MIKYLQLVRFAVLMLRIFIL